MTTPTILEMAETVEKRVHELMEKVRNRYKGNLEINDPHSVYFDLKGSTAGTSVYNYDKESGYLRVNRQIMKDNWKGFDQTIIHEVAHYCVSVIYGRIMSRSGKKRVIHGKEWKNMMIFLGGKTDRCHTYDTSNCGSSIKRKSVTFQYMCDCQFFELSKIRHNRIQKGTQYSCTKCSGTLIPV